LGRTTAMVSGAWPLRRRERPSLKTTSRTRGIEPGGGEIVAPLAGEPALASGFALDHPDHGEAGKRHLARVAPVREQPGHVVADRMAAGLDPAVVAIGGLASLDSVGRSSGMAVISFDLPLTASCPSPRR
jgi:hypothetical protein